MSQDIKITVTGVDIGSANFKIAAVVKGGVQIIVNEANMRQTPNVVGLGPKQRQIGELGKLKIKSNHANTVVAPSRLLGFHHSSSYTSSQLNFVPSKLQKNIQDFAFSLQYGEKVEKFSAQQLMGSLITQIQTTISQTNQFQNKNMVIAVPGYLTQHEREAIMDAIQIARKGVKNDYSIQLVNEQVATSMDYGYYRRAQFRQEVQNPKNVLFIDLGHSKCNMFLTAFNKQHFRIINTAYDRQLGVKYMDWQILKFYASQFDSKNTHLDIKLMQSKKAIQKLLQRIEKQRKILSGVEEADVNVECLLEGEDYYYTLKRQRFEQLCNSLITRFRQLLSGFINEINSKGIKIDSVELIGGGTRIPAILNVIRSILGEQPSRTLNSSECIAKGAALVSAVNSSIFRAQPFTFFQNCRYNVDLIVNGVKYDKRLIERNETLIEKDKTFQIEVQQGVDKLTLTAQYGQGQIEQGLENKLFEALLLLKQNKTKTSRSTKKQPIKQEGIEKQVTSHKILLHYTIDPYNYLISFTKVTSQSHTIQTLQVNKFRHLTQQQLALMQKLQKEMTIRDLKIKRFYHKKNQFESTCYNLRNQLDDLSSQQDKQYVQQSKQQQLREIIQKEINHLEQMDLDHIDSTQELDKKQHQLQQQCQQFILSVQTLKNQYHLLNNQLKQLSSLIQNIISTRDQHHYPQQVNQIGQWINSIFQKLQKSPKYLPPPFTPQQVKQTKTQLQNQLKLFDQQIERKRTMSARQGIRTRQQHQNQNPTGTFFRPQSSYNPFQGSPSNSYDSHSHYKPRGFWDGGFF